MIAAIVCGLVLCGAVVDEPYPAWATQTVRDSVLPPSVGKRLTPKELAALRDGEPLLPYGDVTVGVRLADGGALWVGSKRGLMYREPQGAWWQLFKSRRWLPDDQVLDLAVKADGSVWVRTPAGIARVYRRETTLEKKMAAVHAELRRRHLREGLVGEISVKEPGRLDAGYVQHDNDNDGLWTSLYVAAEAFRYGATGDPEAKKNAWRSLQALMFLEKVTGISGFVARSILPSSDPRPKSGEWHRSADGRWWWKGDTSSDELDGHYFAYAVYFNTAASDAEKEQIRQVVGRITDHMIDHGFYYVGPTGKPTSWGVWAPEKLNRDLEWIGDRGLNSLEILSHLKVAAHIVGKPRYAEAARELIERHGYAINTVRQKSVWPSEVNHSDDELAFLAYYPLVWYEREGELRKIYLASLRHTWLVERPEESPFLNFIYAACLQASTWTEPGRRPTSAIVEAAAYGLDVCLEWFREVPEDLFEWTVTNSDRQDLGEVRTSRFRRPESTFVLSIAERRVMKWNGDPYELDGGNGGRSRDDGTFILLPYWMGRYHRLLE